MKVCYVDESGNSHDPCIVMVGILVDASRLNRTQVEFGDIFTTIQDFFQQNLREVKGAKLVGGKGGWKKVAPSVRKEIVHLVCDWISRRKHHLVLTAVDRDLFESSESRLQRSCNDPWLACGLHVALQIQKKYIRTKRNKGKTFLIFDDNKWKADQLSDILIEPPQWTDQYYSTKRVRERLDQIIDTSLAINSRHAGLVQVADIFAYIFRRYAELFGYDRSESWRGEKNLIESSVLMLQQRLLIRPWLVRPQNESHKWFNRVAPLALRKIKKQ